MSKEIIQITSDPVGEGKERTCFVHPDDPAKAIKVSNKGIEKQTDREVVFYNKLQKRKDVKFTNLPRYYGTVNTNQGKGIVVDLIRDYDGHISKSLKWYLQNDYPVSEFEPYLHHLRKYLLDNLVIINHDLIPGNILFQKVSAKEARLVMIDGFGDVIAIQWFNVFSNHVRGKIHRRWGRFIRRMYGFSKKRNQIFEDKDNPRKKLNRLSAEYRLQLEPRQRQETFDDYFPAD